MRVWGRCPQRVQGRALAFLPNAITMDRTDQELIGLLREDARRPVTSLAAALKLSRATVQARIDRLLRDGEILGFTLRMPQANDATRVHAITLLAVTGERAEAVARALRRIPELRTLHSTNGRWDLVAELDSASLAAFDQALARIRRIEGVSATETSLLLTEITA
jgi:DNA-binding Lrp family transcriptional regulator